MTGGASDEADLLSQVISRIRRPPVTMNPRAQDDSVVGNLPEEYERDCLRHYEKDRDLDSHQAVEVDAALIDDDAVREERERSCRQRVAIAVESDADERVASYLERRGQHQDCEGLQDQS